MNNNRKLKIKKMMKKGAPSACVQYLQVALVLVHMKVWIILQEHSLYRQLQIVPRS